MCVLLVKSALAFILVFHKICSPVSFGHIFGFEELILIEVVCLLAGLFRIGTVALPVSAYILSGILFPVDVHGYVRRVW